MRPWTRRATGAVVAGLLVVGASACGGETGDTVGTEQMGTTLVPATPTAPPTPPSTGDPSETSAPGATAPTPETDPPIATEVPAILDFSAPIIGGGQLDAGDEFAGAPVAFWFWAPT